MRFAPQLCPSFSTSELLKVVRSWCVLCILTWTSASGHFGVFQHLSLQKWPEPLMFFTFWLGNLLRATAACHFWHLNFQKWPDTDVLTWIKMCLVPQQRATFRHPNFQKWCRPGVFCTFWLGNVLRATTPCTFSFLVSPHGSAPAALASLLFDPRDPQIIGKTQCFATCLTFAHLYLLSSDSFSFPLLLFCSLLFTSPYVRLSILSEVWLVNFLWLTFVFVCLLVFTCARHFHILQQLDLLRDGLSVWKSQQLVWSVLSNDVNKWTAFSVSFLVLTEGFERGNWCILPIWNWVLHWHVFFFFLGCFFFNGFQWVKRQWGRRCHVFLFPCPFWLLNRGNWVCTERSRSELSARNRRQL